MPWLTLIAVLAAVFLLMVVRHALDGAGPVLDAHDRAGVDDRRARPGRHRRRSRGHVSLDGGLWRARTNRATPIEAGERVRVVAIDGLVLEVEPEEGGRQGRRPLSRAGLSPAQMCNLTLVWATEGRYGARRAKEGG